MLQLLLKCVAVDQCRETVVMGQISKLCFDRFAIADVAADATIALEATGFIEDRHATRTRPDIAIGATAQILEIAERKMGLEDLTMDLDQLGIDPRCHDLAARLSRDRETAATFDVIVPRLAAEEVFELYGKTGA